MAVYQVEYRDRYSAWKNGGVYILGNTKNRALTKVDIISSNHGESFYGIVSYDNEEPNDFKARLDKDNMYRVEIRDVGKTLWNSDGIWIIGNRPKERCTRLNISSDKGKFLYGVIRYDEEEEFEFRGNYTSSYFVENHWGKEASPWHFGGIWSLINTGKEVEFIDIVSKDSGENLLGNIKYEGEEILCLKAKRILGNNYEIYCQKPSGIEAWYRCNDMIIGGRDNQRVIELNCKNNGSEGLFGTMTYEHEGAIGFRAVLI